MSLTVCEQALIDFAAGQALLAPIWIFGGHDALDRTEPVVEALGGIVKFIQQLFVAGSECRGSLPLRDVVKDQPGQPDEQDRDDDNCSEIQVTSPLP